VVASDDKAGKQMLHKPPAPPAPTAAPTGFPPSDGDRPPNGCKCCSGGLVYCNTASNVCADDGAPQKWCYVEDGDCADQREGGHVKTLFAPPWSYLACENEQSGINYIAIETGNCQGQGYEPILDKRECTAAFAKACGYDHLCNQGPADFSPGGVEPEGCYFDERQAGGILHFNPDPKAKGIGADPAGGIAEMRQLCKKLP